MKPADQADAAATATAPEITMSRDFDAPRAQVFNAWTNAEQLRHWMLGPGGWEFTVCEVDPRPGGGYHFTWRSTAGDGAEMTIRGRYLEIESPSRIVAVDSWGDDWPDTTNTLTFSERDGRTTMTLTIRYPSAEARDAALATGMTQGMEAGFDRLDEPHSFHVPYQGAIL